MRLDQALVSRGLVASRSQAESYIKLGKVTVNNKLVTKAGQLVSDADRLAVHVSEQYVSRAALKLASAAEKLGFNFSQRSVLDIGSSTGGFTEYALKHGAERVWAVDVGSHQLHPRLRQDSRITLMEQTDFRGLTRTPFAIDTVLADVSFASLRTILPTALQLVGQADYLVMVKPQFEAADQFKHKGVIKNDALRRKILKDFENWAQEHFIIVSKADSSVAGAKGNRERFYWLKAIQSANY